MILTLQIPDAYRTHVCAHLAAECDAAAGLVAQLLTEHRVDPTKCEEAQQVWRALAEMIVDQMEE